MVDVKKGIERLARVYCWPNDPTTADKDKYEFKALCEFVLFKQFVMIPFFKSLLKYLFKHIARLYQYVASLHIENAHMLTYKEAYLFMRDLEVDKVKLILEKVSCPSNVYNGIIRSLEEENYDLFLSALDKSDHTKMMQVLWMMRYILLGEKGNWDNIDPATPHLALLPYLPRWIKMDDYCYRPYFEIHEYDGEDIFIDERVIEIVDGRLRKKKRTAKNPSPINNRSDNYEEDNKKELDRLFEESLFKSQWKDLLTEYSDNGNLPLGKSWVNRSYIEDTARLVLTHNVILHKDEVMEKYGIDSSEMYNEFINSEVYIYESEDCKDFGRYILFFTREMLSIYNMVENILDDDSKKELKSILYSSRYTVLLESVVFSSTQQEMTESAKTGNNVSNSNNRCFDKNAIVLNLPRLLEKYCDKYCTSMAKRGEGCTKEMIEYYLWGANEIPLNAISKDKPLVWTGSRQLFVAYIRFLYLENDSKQRIPSTTKGRLESSVIMDGKPLEYTSISSETLEKDINDIKKEIDWNEEDNKKEKVVKHEKFR